MEEDCTEVFPHVLVYTEVFPHVLLYSNVKRFVQVLRLFVPGGSGAVLPWLEMPSSSVSVLSKQGAPGNMPVLTTHHLLK